jgi:GH25 family lysozyme M1 (1,4-beta-N-acetylmuramidase)
LRFRRPMALRRIRLVVALTFGLLALTLTTVATTAAPATTAPVTVVSTLRSSLCDGATLRTGPSASASRKASIAKGTTVTVSATVAGGTWSTSCGGKTTSGHAWYQISRINGKTVSSLYKVTSLYAASGLFKTATVSVAAACDGAVLRTAPSTGSSRTASVKPGATITVSATVKGASWSVNCTGATVSASTWYRITAVEGKGVSSLYGVATVYAATGLFKPATAHVDDPKTPIPPVGSPLPTPTPAPTATPKPTAGPTPTPKPSSTPKPSPTAAPTPTPTPSPSATPSASPTPTGAPTPAPTPTPTPTPTQATTTSDCDVILYPAASLTASAVASISANSVVTVASVVTGDAWSNACANPALQGTSWLHIVAVNGTPTSLLFGAPDLYAIAGAFQTVGAPSPTPTPAPGGGPTLAGVDVSSHEGTINWQQVAASGARFAWIKSTEGTEFVDSKWTANRAAANAAGLVVGAFHYAQPSSSTSDAAAQADHFVDVSQFQAGDLLPVLDVEITNGVSTKGMQAWVAAFLNRVYQRTAIHCVIYTSPNFWRENLGDTSQFAASGSSLLWVAHWTTAAAPSVPASNWGGAGWAVWQYSDKGIVPGISTPTDLDRLNGTNLSAIQIP